MDLTSGVPHYTIAQVARLLGMTRQNVHQRVKRGSISSIQVNGKTVIPASFVYDELSLSKREKTNVNGG